jgi:hypothetical protein
MSFDSLSVAMQDIYGCVEAGSCGKGLRLALVRGELIRAPRAARRLSILSGTAWVSFGGEDFFLCRGESLSLGRSLPGPALVSALGESALFVEIE